MISIDIWASLILITQIKIGFRLHDKITNIHDIHGKRGFRVGHVKRNQLNSFMLDNRNFMQKESSIHNKGKVHQLQGPQIMF